MLRIAAILIASVMFQSASSWATCRTWTVPDVVCRDPSGINPPVATPMCVKDNNNITCQPHNPTDCASIYENITCDSEQEFNDFQAMHPHTQLNPGR